MAVRNSDRDPAKAGFRKAQQALSLRLAHPDPLLEEEGRISPPLRGEGQGGVSLFIDHLTTLSVKQS